MPRPLKKRSTRFNPNVNYYKPRGVPLAQLEAVILQKDELEAIKLHDYDGLDHIEAAKQLSVSQPTFGRILNSAYQKIAEALVNGKAIEIYKN